MYNLLLDSDALIKLAYSGVLVQVCQTFNCITTEEVRHETVDEGKKRLYPDADIIEAVFENKLLKIKKPKTKIRESSRLGKGELSIFELSKNVKNCILVSDDKTFLRELEKEDIDFLVPPDLIVLLRQKRKISCEDARRYINQMKAFIGEEAYREAIKNLGGS